jgi:hypothetical protein
MDNGTVTDNRWVPIYFTKSQWDSWKSGNLAVAFTQEDRDNMRRLESAGISCVLADDPLDHMTKVHPLSFRRIEDAMFGVYIP